MKNNIAELDGFRGISILLVVLSHIGSIGKIIPGGFGVTIFFFISGFLITLLLIKEFENYKHINVKYFFLRRFFRLYPVLFFFMLITIPFVYLRTNTIFIKDIIAGFLYYTNYYIPFWKLSNHEQLSNIFNILWSLSIEEHFYLFYPFIFSYFIKSENNLLYIILALIISSLVFRIFILYNNSNFDIATSIIYHSTHTRIDSISFGCLSAILIFKNQNSKYIKIVQNLKYLFLGVLLILFSLTFRNPFFRESFRYTIQGAGLLVIIPYFIYLNNENIFKRILKSKILVFFGKISYSLYLFHWFSREVINSFIKEINFTWFIYFFFLTLILTLVSHFFIDKIFINFRKRYGSNI